MPSCSRLSRSGLEALRQTAPLACRPSLTAARHDGLGNVQAGTERRRTSLIRRWGATHDDPEDRRGVVTAWEWPNPLAYYLPTRFRAFALFSRRPPERVDRLPNFSTIGVRP